MVSPPLSVKKAVIVLFALRRDSTARRTRPIPSSIVVMHAAYVRRASAHLQDEHGGAISVVHGTHRERGTVSEWLCSAAAHQDSEHESSAGRSAYSARAAADARRGLCGAMCATKSRYGRSSPSRAATNATAASLSSSVTYAFLYSLTRAWSSHRRV